MGEHDVEQIVVECVADDCNCRLIVPENILQVQQLLSCPDCGSRMDHDPDTEWVFVAENTEDVYHTDPECQRLNCGGRVDETASVEPVPRSELGPSARECETCRVSWVPTLDDVPDERDRDRDRAQTETAPWLVALGSALGLAILLWGIYGGVL
ncbi:hypothetical protein [Halobellus rubicundus]|uniref:Uncharacterized protein n=1 Tax=Halobellus rubicundus TaxID=2996466 RepID=A0ABD5MDV8_9EURY